MARKRKSGRIKSQAQRRKFAQLLVEGKISDETYEEWNRETGRKELPERVTPKETPAGKKPARKPARKKTARKAAAPKKTTGKTTVRRKRRA